MTHNPFANAHPVGGRPWTNEEDATVARMLQEGFRLQQAADAIGRTLYAVQSRLRFLNNDRPKRARKTGRNHVCSESVNVIIPPEVEADRARRYMAPRSLTAILMGDPPFPAARERT